MMKIQNLALFFVSLIIGISSQAQYKETPTCESLAELDPGFDLEACQSEMDKTLPQVDYVSLYQETTLKPWENKAVTLRSAESCEIFAEKAYSNDEIETHLTVHELVTPPLSDKNKASTHQTEKKRKKKNPCYNLILSERMILKKLNLLVQELNTKNSKNTHSIQKIIHQGSLMDSIRWPSSLALEIGLLLKEDHQLVESIAFLRLVFQSSLKPDYSGTLQLSSALLDDYNSRVTTDHESLTSEAYLLIQGALYLLNHARSSDASQQRFVTELSSRLKKLRNHMIRWPLSPQGLVEDTYFPQGQVARTLYAKGFVDELLSHLESFENITDIKKYQGRKNIQKKSLDGGALSDLADLLYQAGFYGVEGYCSISPQHTWIHPHGLIVRVKKSNYTHQWEFTLGLTFLNPLNWTKSNSDQTLATSLVKLNQMKTEQSELNGTPYLKTFTHPSYQYNNTLIRFKYNEAFKIRIKPGGWVTVMPAFQGYRTGNHWGNHVDIEDELKSAHYPLEKVGQPGEDLSIIQSYYLSNLR